MPGELSRMCRKTHCRSAAAASLSFKYDTKQVWLLDLTAEGDPSLYDLCERHADALTVPRGWERVEQRAEALAQAAQAAQLSAPVAEHQPAEPAPEPSRYDALRATLPRVAAELVERQQRAYGEPLEPDEPDEDRQPVQPHPPGQLTLDGLESVGETQDLACGDPAYGDPACGDAPHAEDDGVVVEIQFGRRGSATRAADQ